MNWFIISLLPPAIWAATNYIDKYLLNKYFQKVSAGPLVLMTALAGACAVPVIALFFFDRTHLNPSSEILLILSGILSMTGGIFYVLALSKDEPGVVIPLFQIIPVFNYILGLVFLDEHLSTTQLLASILIISGAIAIGLDLTDKKPRIKTGILGLMLIACLIASCNNLLFKSVVSGENYWGSVYWSYTGYAIFGAFVLIFIKKWRETFFTMFSLGKSKVLGLAVINEGLNITAVLIYNFALLSLPIALVSVIGNGLQPFFVLIFGVLFTLFIPSLGNEALGKKHLAQKILAVMVIFMGTYLLNR